MRFFALSLMIVCTLAAKAQTKIAHVDYQKVIELLAVKDSVTEKLQSLQKEMQQDLMKRNQELQNAQTSLYNKKDSMSAFMKKAQQESIQQQASMLQQKQQQYEQQLQQYQMQLTQPLLDKVDEAIAALAKEKGLTYVIDLNAAVYAGGMDITDLVIKKLGLENVQLPQNSALPAAGGAGGQPVGYPQGY